MADQRAQWKSKLLERLKMEPAQANWTVISTLCRCREVHIIGGKRESDRLILSEINDDEGEREMSKLSITYCITVSLN